MGRRASQDRDYEELRPLYDAIMGEPDSGALDLAPADPEALQTKVREALREGLISSESLADEVVTDILLKGRTDADRLRAAEMIRKASQDRRGEFMGSPPNEDDLERFQRVLIETGTIREAIEERREVPAHSS